MPSEVEVVQDALLEIGERKVTASGSTLSTIDSSAAGQIIKQTFERKRDAMLRDHPWNFALRRGFIHADRQRPSHGFRFRYPLADFDKNYFQADSSAHVVLLDNSINASILGITVPFTYAYVAHSYKTGQGPYRFTAGAGGLPTPLVAGTDYWVEEYAITGTILARAFRVSLSRFGSVVDLTVLGGAGPHTIAPSGLTILRVWDVEGASEANEWTLEGGYIYTDLTSPIFLNVVFQEATLNNWDPVAIQAFTKLLAATWAVPIANNATLAGLKMQEYNDILADAKSIDGQEDFPTDPSADLSSWILAR